MEPVFSFAIDLSVGPRLQTLHRKLRAALREGRFAAGAALPSTRAAASQLGVARNTVIAAYDRLAAEGYLELRPRAPPRVIDLGKRRSLRGESAAPAAAAAPDSLVSTTPPLRSFRLGVPDSTRFPHALWRRLAARSLRRMARDPFGYPPVAGLPRLRSAIAAHLAFARAVACSGEQIVVTSGAQQAFHLIARWLVNQGRVRIAVEDPGYPPMRAAFQAAGAQLVPVAVDEAGLRVEDMPDAVDAIAVTPSHQAPSGVAMSLQRRTDLIEFARRRRCFVIEDDYDGEFRFGVHPLDALQTLDEHSRVLYVGTFSKSLHPAIRKGYIVVPERARTDLLALKSAVDGGVELSGQETLASFIEEGHLARHIRRMRSIYGERRALLHQALAGPLSDCFEELPGAAGLHLCARVRGVLRPQSVLRLALRELPGALDVADWRIGRSRDSALAIGYGCAETRTIQLALKRLDAALMKEIR